MRRAGREQTLDERAGGCIALIRGFRKLAVKQDHYPCPVTQQILACVHVVQTKERDSRQPALLQVRVSVFTSGKDATEADHFFRIDVQQPNRIEEPRPLGAHLGRIFAVQVVVARYRKVILLEPRITGLAGDCVVHEVIRQKIVSIAISGGSRQADSFTDSTSRTLLHVALRAEVLDVQLMPTESPRLEFPFAEAALASPLQFHEDRLHLASYGALLFVLLLAAELLGSPFRPRTPARDILLDPRTKLLEARGVADQDAVPESSTISSRAASPSPTRVLSMSSRIRRVCVPVRVVSRPKSSVRRI